MKTAATMDNTAEPASGPPIERNVPRSPVITTNLARGELDGSPPVSRVAHLCGQYI